MGGGLEPVWKALADGSRRKILDLLRDGPKTTGQLCEHFAMSRFGVMKHLDVLKAAGLVTVRRRGRERWNHLDAVPIRRIYQRWVGKYEGARWASLLALEYKAEARKGAPDMQEQQGRDIDSFQIAQEVVIAAPREAVWRALTANIGGWWAFRLTDERATMRLDARLGGHFIEEHPEGAGVLWGTVTQMSPGRMLQLTGPLGMVGAPVNSVYTFELEEHGGGTRLGITHRCLGVLEPDWARDHETGWQSLLGIYLKGYLEDGKSWKELAS